VVPALSNFEFLRIGDKLIDRTKIARAVDEILRLRALGLSQQEVANRLLVDRTFVSRLEGVGEVRKGGSMAVVGFPVANDQEIRQAANEEGVDFVFVLSHRERWEFLDKAGVVLFEEVMNLVTEARKHGMVVILGHNRPALFLNALLDRDVTVHQVPQTPGTEGHFDVAALRKVIKSMKS
jgi:hypothetical protein